MSSKQFFHSVTLDKDKCHGCINCVKRCPTEAIRVRDGKATIISERCIDCGECIRVCPHHAKQAIFDPIASMSQFSYKIALPPPSFYGQFNNLEDVDIVLAALLKMGFDDVFEVARAAEFVSEMLRNYLADERVPHPVISSACPAILRLIRVRFPELLNNVFPFHSPMEIAARMAKEEAAKKTGLPPEKIGAVFLSPCPAKVTATKMALGAEKSEVDVVLAVREVYPRLLSLMKTVTPIELAHAGRIGIGWGSSGGEAAASLTERYLAADGIENCMGVLDGLEDEKFLGLDFVELNACSGGCVGGVLNVENPYIARTKLAQLRKYLPVARAHLGRENLPQAQDFFEWDVPVEYEPVLELDPDIEVAMEKLREIGTIQNRLYGMDCGSCGAPNCRALAEDIVRGFAQEEACIYKLREEVQQIADGLANLSRYMPKASGAEKDTDQTGERVTI